MEKIPDSQWLASMVVAAYSEERYDLGLALARLQCQAVRMERDVALAPAVPVTVVDPEVYEPTHVQKREQVTGQELPIDVCQDCGMEIGWWIKGQEWTHIRDGQAVTSPLPPHVGRPAAEALSPVTERALRAGWAAAVDDGPDPRMPNEGRETPAAPWATCLPDGNGLCVNEIHGHELPAEDATTLVTPSARCIAIIGPIGRQQECHGVLYWPGDPGAPGWMHLDPKLGDHHAPVPNRLDP